MRPTATNSITKKSNTHGARMCRHSSPRSRCISTDSSPCRLFPILVSLPQLARSAMAALFCVSSCLQLGSATGTGNNAQRLQNTLQCVNLHAHRLLCNNHQHLCCSRSLDSFFSKNFFPGHLPAQFALIPTCYTTPANHPASEKKVKGASPSGKSSKLVCPRFQKGQNKKESACVCWHPPECSHYKSKGGCK